MSNTAKGYSQTLDYLKNIFNDCLPEKLAEIQETNINKVLEWCTSTYYELLRIKKDDELRHHKKIQILEKRQPDLEKCIQSFEKDAIYDQCKGAIRECVDTLPKQVTENQAEERFSVLKDDSFKVKLFKTTKAVAKKVAGLFRKNSANTHWKQNVPLRNIAGYHLLTNQSFFENFIAGQYEILVKGLDHLLEISLDELQDETQIKPNKDDFKLEFVGNIEEQLQHTITYLKSKKETSDFSLNKVLTDCINDAERADTLELSTEKFSEAFIQKGSSKIESQILNAEKTWIKYLQTQYSDLKVQVEIARFGWVAANVQKQILELNHQYFRNFCYLPMEKGVEVVKELSAAISEKSSSTFSDKEINGLRQHVDEDFREKLLSPMYDSNAHEKLLNQIHAAISNLQIESQQFSEVVEMSAEREIDYPVPKIKIDTIQWKSLAGRFFKEKAVRRLDPGSKNLEQFVQKMAEDVEEALRIVDINLMAALESKDSDKEENPIEIAKGGLNRAHKLFEDSIKNVRKKQDEYEALVHEKLPAALHELSGLMMSRSYDKFELRDKAIQVKERAMDWRVQIIKRFDKVAEKSELAWRFISRKFRIFQKSAGRFLGFKTEEVISVREKRDLTEYLSTLKSESPLPFVYKRLFSDASLADDRFYVMPKQADQYLRDSYKDWVNNLDANVLIIGEKGSGKSSAFTYMQRNIMEDEESIQIAFKETIFTEEDLIKRLSASFGYKNVKTKEQFIQRVKKKRKGVVVCIENLQNIFIRNVHGFEALECFWVIMSATREHLFWVVTCSRYSWKFIEKMSGADQYFSHLVEVDTLDEEKVKNAILSRHKATGYELRYEASQLIQKSRAFRKKIDDEFELQSYLEDNYFQRLTKVSEGNISIAIIFWLQSISKFDDQTFYISPIEITNVDKLEIPSREVLFTLASLVIHDTLTIDEMAKSLHQEFNEAQLMLTRLKSKGIVTETEFGYSLNHLVYRQVVRLLKRRNIIH